MMETSTANLSVERRGPALVLTLNRPERANAYDEALLFALRDALTAALLDNEVRAVVLTGAGDRHFCAGADLAGIGTRGVLDVLDLPSSHLFDAVAAFPKPVIAAVNGAAVGGGVELAAACDLRVASENAFFSLPETGLGLIPAAGGVLRLPRIVGLGRAKEMILLGRRVDAAMAWNWGLVNELCPPGEALRRALALAEILAEKAPDALALAKDNLDPVRADAVRASLARLSQALLTSRKS